MGSHRSSLRFPCPVSRPRELCQPVYHPPSFSLNCEEAFTPAGSNGQVCARTQEEKNGQQKWFEISESQWERCEQEHARIEQIKDEQFVVRALPKADTGYC